MEGDERPSLGLPLPGLVRSSCRFDVEVRGGVCCSCQYLSQEIEIVTKVTKYSIAAAQRLISNPNASYHIKWDGKNKYTLRQVRPDSS